MRHVSYIHIQFPAVMTAFLLMLLTVSCLKDAPETLPETVEWNPELAFPLGENSYNLFDVTDFDSSQIELDTVTGIPEWLEPEKPIKVSMEGELDIDLAAILENLDQIRGILFRVNFENSFPDEIFAQGYFRNAGNFDLDSMFIEGPVPVPPAVVRQDGNLVRTGQARKDAYFDQDRIGALEEATTLYLRAYFMVTDPDSALIPHYPDFRFDVQLGAVFDFTLEF